MPSYRVVWEIDIDAADERQAATMAREIQRDVASLATVFYVSDPANVSQFGDIPTVIGLAPGGPSA